MISSPPRLGKQMWKGLQFPGLQTQLLVVSPLPMGPVITERTVTHHSPKSWAQGAGSNTLCVSAVKTEPKRTENNPIPPCLALSPLCGNAEDFRRGWLVSFSAATKSSRVLLIFRTNAVSRACCFSCPDWWSCQRE